MNQLTRRRARECAVQALYSWQISKNNIYDITKQFFNKKKLSNIDINYFYEIYTGVTINYKILDNLMTPYLSRSLKTIGYVELAILRISLFELSKKKDIPFKVSINEAIELAKIFGAEDSHKFINGVLDKVAFKIESNK